MKNSLKTSVIFDVAAPDFKNTASDKSMAVFIQKTKFSSRRNFRLKYLFVYQYKHGKNASDGRILRRKFRLNLCVETTHKLNLFVLIYSSIFPSVKFYPSRIYTDENFV